MKIVYKNLIDVDTGKSIVYHLPKNIDRRKFRKEQRKIQIQAKEFARRLSKAFNE